MIPTRLLFLIFLLFQSLKCSIDAKQHVWEKEPTCNLCTFTYSDDMEIMEGHPEVHEAFINNGVNAISAFRIEEHGKVPATIVICRLICRYIAGRIPVAGQPSANGLPGIVAHQPYPPQQTGYGTGGYPHSGQVPGGQAPYGFGAGGNQSPGYLPSGHTPTGFGSGGHQPPRTLPGGYTSNGFGTGTVNGFAGQQPASTGFDGRPTNPFRPNGPRQHLGRLVEMKDRIKMDIMRRKHQKGNGRWTREDSSFNSELGAQYNMEDLIELMEAVIEEDRAVCGSADGVVTEDQIVERTVSDEAAHNPDSFNAITKSTTISPKRTPIVVVPIVTYAKIIDYN